MLSRVADSLYWLGRYIERAENNARMLDVNLQLMLDATLVKGSHGLPGVGREPPDWPVMIGDGPAPPATDLPMISVRDLVLGALGFL